MLFANDITSVDETRSMVNVKLELWRLTLESRDLKLIRSKTNYTRCKFGKYRIQDYSIASLDGRAIPMSNQFRYLDFIIQKDGEIDNNVNHRIQTGAIIKMERNLSFTRT